MSLLKLVQPHIQWHAIRAQGAGGQNVNKVSSAIHLKLAIAQTQLPDRVKQRLLTLRDSRISNEGVITIKAQRFRTQEQNLRDAEQRLEQLLIAASHQPKLRKPTKPTRASQRRRMEGKKLRSSVKSMRGKVVY